MTEVRSSHRQLIPDIVDQGKHEPTFLRGIANKARMRPEYRFRDLSRFHTHKKPLSYGYRPKRGARGAVDDLTVRMQFGKFGYVVEADIKGFFNHLDHDVLLKMVAHRVDDKRFIRLINKWLKAGILEEDQSIQYPRRHFSRRKYLTDISQYLSSLCY